MAKTLKESKIIIWDECTMAHKRALEALDRTLKDLCNGSEMLWRRTDFTVWRFSPNTVSHSKIDCCRWNKRLPQIIKSVALCEETSTDNKHESCIAERSIWWRFIQAIVDYRWWLCPCRRIEQIDIISLEFLQFRFIETKCSRISFITTKITNGWVNEQFWRPKTKMWMTLTS